MPKSYSPPPGARSRELEAKGSAAAEGARPDHSPTTGGPCQLSQRVRATLQVTCGPLLAAGLIMASVAAFILAAFFFLLPPGLDLGVADIFYIPGHGFIGHVPWVAALRFALKGIYVVGVTLAVIGLLRSVITARQFAGLTALAFLVTRRSTVLICAALAMGSLVGLIRMAQGANFLSDVAFAGIFMCVSVTGLHLLIIDAQPLWRRAASALADRRGRNDRNH
jgi:membrane-associated PAP2 superfamily phosphatase